MVTSRSRGGLDSTHSPVAEPDRRGWRDARVCQTAKRIGDPLASGVQYVDLHVGLPVAVLDEERATARATSRIVGKGARRRSGMTRVIFTANIQRHVGCPEAEASGRTVREVLEGVFAANPGAGSYVLDDQAAGVGRVSARVPAEGRRARYLAEQGDGA